MKRAFSRKNAWSALPRPLRSVAGKALGLVPLPLLLGPRFCAQRHLLRAAERWSPEQVRAYQLTQLKQLCTVAFEQTAYYREQFRQAGFDPRDLGSADALQSLPTIDRSTLQAHLPDMCAVSADGPGVDYVTTGGTSGVPLGFYIGAERSAIEYAYIVAGWERAGYRAGATLAVLRGRVVDADRHGMRHEHDPLLRHHYYSAFHLTDANIVTYLDHLEGIGTCFLHVYPSSVTTLARFLRRTNRRAPSNVRAILAESEIVYPEQRTLVEEVFGCRMLSSYGMTEKVVAAVQCEASTDYHVWPTYGLCELIDEHGQRVTTPGMRGEIVGTGFMNRVVPFIRYRTGDHATYVADACEACGRQQMVVRDIRGHRIQEALIAREGSAISWTALNMHDDTFDRVLRFQFYQDTPGRAVLRLVPGEGFGEQDRQRILRRLESKLDGQVEITMELVSSIELSRSGKAIYVDQRIAGAAAREAHAERPDALLEPVTIGSAH